MLRRLATLLLTVALVCAGVTVGACPRGHCAMRQAKAASCCQHDGLARPSCCPPVEQVGQQAMPPATERPAEAVAQVAWQVEPIALPAPPLVPLAAPVAIDPGSAPPGTLIAQHTALLL